MTLPNSEDKLLLRILNELPLREVLLLRAVNSRWKRVIETRICKEKKSLKIFSSLQSILDYYKMVNTQGYLKNNGYKVDLDNFAYRRPEEWELANVDLPSGCKFFPNFKLPEDDHLIINFQHHLLVTNLLLRLFPKLESLVIFGIDNFNERYLRFPFSLNSLKRLELYDPVDPKGNPNDSSNNRVAPRSVLEDISVSYRQLYTTSLRHIEELALDGVYLSKYCLWHLLMAVKDELALKRLKLSRFTENQLKTGRVVKAAASAKVCGQLTHLTVDSINYNVLEFFVQTFLNLEYLDIGVEEGIKSYDVFASIFYFRKLTELRIHCADPNFLIPIGLNNIFQPYTFPAVKKLHLYVSQMNHEKLSLITLRIFPTVQMLVLDVGLYCCPCDYPKGMLTEYYSERSEFLGIHSQRPEFLGPVCSTCISKLPSALPSDLELHFYDGRQVSDTFSQLNASFYIDQMSQKHAKAYQNLLDLEEDDVGFVSSTPESSPTAPVQDREPLHFSRRPNVLQRVRNGLFRRRRTRATAVLNSASASLASINNAASSSEGTLRDRSTATASTSAQEAETDGTSENDFRSRDTEFGPWFELDEDEEEEEEEFDDDELELLNVGPSSDEDDEDYTLLFL